MCTNVYREYIPNILADQTYREKGGRFKEILKLYPEYKIFAIYLTIYCKYLVWSNTSSKGWYTNMINISPNILQIVWLIKYIVRREVRSACKMQAVPFQSSRWRSNKEYMWVRLIKDWDFYLDFWHCWVLSFILRINFFLP